MSLLSRQFLTDLGIHLDDENYASLDSHFEDTLYRRVVDEVVIELSPEQAEELASLQGSDDAIIQQWLTTHVEDLPEIVSDEIDILIGELAEHSEILLDQPES